MIDFNDSSTWVNAEIHTPPSGVDVAAFQNKIDHICGFAPNGMSSVVLSWMPAMENYAKYYSSWDAGGFGAAAHLRALYKFHTLYDPEGNPIDVPPPRWALKQYQHPSQYLETDEATRWQKTESNVKYEQNERGQTVPIAGQTHLKELRPPHSRTGRYVPLMRIGKHNDFCCPATKQTGLVCFGEYREPDESYLTVLRRAVFIRSEENGQNPNAPISQQTLVRAASEAAAIEQAKREESRQIVSDLVDEHYTELVSAATGENKYKQFSLPQNFKYKSGLIVPNN